MNREDKRHLKEVPWYAGVSGGDFSCKSESTVGSGCGQEEDGQEDGEPEHGGRQQAHEQEPGEGEDAGGEEGEEDEVPGVSQVLPNLLPNLEEGWEIRIDQKQLCEKEMTT